MIRVAGVQVLMLLALMAEICHAQQDPQFTHYMFNQLYFNPAYAGIEKGARFTALHRSQWLGYESTFDAGGAPSTQLISFTMPLAPIRGGNRRVYCERPAGAGDQPRNSDNRCAPFQNQGGSIEFGRSGRHVLAKY